MLKVYNLILTVFFVFLPFELSANISKFLQQATSDPNEYVSVIKIVLVLTVLSLAPAILIMMTSFLRFLIVFSFLRQALGLPQVPPNQVIIGLSLFLTAFLMEPVFRESYTSGLKPLLEGKLSQEESWEKTISPFRKFMFSQVRGEELNKFITLAEAGGGSPIKSISNLSEVSTWTLIPAFLLSELKTAFYIGFLIFIPFLIIDLVVSSVLMAMGMMMLPPMMISLPLKIMLFVFIDGWSLLIGSLVKSFGV